MPFRTLLFAWLLAVSAGAWTQTDKTSSGNCRTLYTRDDPALFEFVKTRETVRYERYAGMRIAGIEVVVLPIFNENNPEEDNWLFRAANTLHIDTRASTIERQMIIENGEPLDPQRLRENERLLRGNNYLVDAMILPHRVCGNRIHLLAVVRDVWTLTPSASASREGGENSSTAGLTERNLLGTGQHVSVGYFDNAERSGQTLSYRHPYILGEHTRLSLELENNSDGHAQSIGLARPFYKLDSTWSAGVSANESTEIETIEDGDRVTNRYRQSSHYYSASLGWSTGRVNGVVNRWQLGITDSENRYERLARAPSSPPADRRLRYPWANWVSIEDRYKTLSNITHSHRHEDILLGFYHNIQLGHARERWGSTENAWIFRFHHQYTASFGDHHLLRLGGSANGRYDLDTHLPENTVYSGFARYYHFPDKRNRWYARYRYQVGRNLDDDDKFTAGGDDTLRGYPDDVQRGNRQWLFTLERRNFTNIHLFNLVYLGGAAYVDAGRTWDTHAPASRNNPVLSNVGIGLRATPSKFNVDKVLHLDIAWPLAERDRVDSHQILVGGEVDF